MNNTQHGLTRADYKTIKHMDKNQLSAYLQRIYLRGYNAGKEVAEKRNKTEQKKQ